jgi:hypothetical protein
MIRGRYVFESNLVFGAEKAANRRMVVRQGDCRVKACIAAGRGAMQRQQEHGNWLNNMGLAAWIAA